MKKAISVLLAAILLLSTAPVSLFANADDGIYKSGIWTYEIDSKSGVTYARILGVDRVVDGKIEIPERLAGYAVCDWDPNLFKDFSDYELVIPAGVPNDEYMNWILSDSIGEYPRIAANAVADFLLHFSLFEYVSFVAANKITAASENAYYHSKDGVLYNKNMTALIKYPVCSDASSYELPASVPLIPSFVIDLAPYAGIFDDLSSFDFIQGYPLTLLNDGSCVFAADESWSSGLTVHVSAAHFNEVFSTTAPYASEYMEKIWFLTIYLAFPFFGTAKICTDYNDQTVIGLLQELFAEIQNDEKLDIPGEHVPDIEPCSGHAADKEITSVSVAALPNKTAYTVGESFVETGLSLHITYSDGTSEVVSSGMTCTGFSSDSPGTKTITVTYQGMTTSFTVTVTASAQNIPGDVNGDGEVTLVDAALISRHLVGGWNVTIDLDAADVDDDGTVTLKDSALISRFIVGGWGVTLR